jgi:branched-chain amino acid transport system ATP-binding protein
VALLEARGVNVRFGGHAAVTDADIDVEVGRVTGLIGPNGAGKTTLFNVLTGLQPCVSGRVSLNGIEITGMAPHDRAQRGLARTFQRLELFGSLTARENLLVAAEIPRRFGAPPAGLTAAQRVDEVVDLVGLGAFVDQRADELTTGHARLLELGRALVTRPKVLLLDEPASGLDADETAYLARLLRELADSGLAVLLVEHDVPLVMQVCRRVYVLDLGKVISVGTPEEIRVDQRVVDAYLGQEVP